MTTDDYNGSETIIGIDADGTASYHNMDNKALDFATDKIRRMAIYPSGNTGKGNVDPQSKLVIKSPDETVRNLPDITDHSCNAIARFRRSSTEARKCLVYTGAGTPAFFFESDGYRYFNHGSQGIGTTDPSPLLDVHDNARIRNVTAGSYSTPLNRTSDGTLTTSTSDVRLKTSIQSLQYSLDKVLQVQGVSFLWKDNPQMGRRIGFVALDFEKVLPKLSFTNPADGYKCINYAELTAVLAEAIKELNNKNELLLQENRQLEERMDKPEQKLNASVR
jgi:Chaperone of endosialidase